MFSKIHVTGSGTHFSRARNPLWLGLEPNLVGKGTNLVEFRNLIWWGQEPTMRGSGIKFNVTRKPNQWDQAPTLAGSGMHFSRTKKTIGGVRKLFITYFLNAIILSVRKWENNWSRDVYSLLKSWSLHVWQKCLTLLRVRAHFWPGLLFIVCSRNFSWVTPHIISWLIFDDDTLFWAK